MRQTRPTLSYARPAVIERRGTKLALVSLVLAAYTGVMEFVLLSSCATAWHWRDRLIVGAYLSILLAFVCSFAFGIAAKNSRSELRRCALFVWGMTAPAVVGLLYFVVCHPPRY